MPTKRPSAATATVLDRVLEHALAKPGAWLDHPWGEDHDVAKVGSRMFLSIGATRDEPAFSVKHEDLDDCQMWRGRYPDAIGPTRYLVDKPWSTVYLARGIDEDDAIELVEESYVAVVRRLAKKDRPRGWDAGLTD